MFQAAKPLDDALAAITDGCMLVVPREASGVPMAATRALIRRGVKRLHLVALPTSSLQADLLAKIDQLNKDPKVSGLILQTNGAFSGKLLAISSIPYFLRRLVVS